MSEAAEEVLSLAINSDDPVAEAIKALALSPLNRPEAANSFEALIKVNPRLRPDVTIKPKTYNFDRTM